MGFQEQKSQAVSAIINSLNQGKYVHMSGYAREIYNGLVESGGQVQTTVLEDNLIYFCIPRSTELKMTKNNK
jgi:hypothetical protein